MTSVALAGLVKIELPNDTIRFSDGDFFVYESEKYNSYSAEFGTISSLRVMSESIGDTVPALTLRILPPDINAAATLSEPGNQKSAVTFVIAEYDYETGVISSGDTFFRGFVDQTMLTVGKNIYELAMTVVSLAERLFEGNIGNSMNPVWHKSVHPGELGHDNATGLAIQVAWGVESPPQNRGGDSGGSGRGRESRFEDFYAY